MTMNTSFIITIIILLIALFAVLKIFENGIPKMIKRKREEWEAEAKSKEIKKLHEDKENMQIQKAVKEEKTELFKKNRKTRAKQHYIDTKKKGDEYEMFIVEYFEKLGYQTKPFGLLNGRKDKGIDVIIKKDKEITLIQCKNWKANSKYKINHENIKAFIGDTTAFLDNNKDKAEGYTIKRLYVTSNDILDNSARHFLKGNKDIIKYQVIPIST